MEEQLGILQLVSGQLAGGEGDWIFVMNHWVSVRKLNTPAL